MLKESIYVLVIIITRTMLSYEHSPAVYVIMTIAYWMINVTESPSGQ